MGFYLNKRTDQSNMVTKCKTTMWVLLSLAVFCVTVADEQDIGECSVKTVITETRSCGSPTSISTGTDTSTDTSTNVQLNKNMQKRLSKIEAWFRERRILYCGAGLQDYRIADNAITTSSNYDANHDIKGIRLHSSRQPVGSWCALMSDPQKWVQVDLLTETSVHGIVIQGRRDSDQWVTLFAVYYKSEESASFQAVLDSSNKQSIFPGNIDRNTPNIVEFDEPIMARFIKVQVKQWHSHPSMRIEILQC